MASISHREMSWEQGASFLERPLWTTLSLNWELVLYGVIFVLAVFTRVYDLGARAISHDESLHALYSYKLYNGEGYQHDPLMHGPVLFEFTALMFFLFGDNNFTFRLGVALFGIVLVMLPYWFRPWLGRAGALIASTFILISPAIVQYSRHVRHDIFVEVFTVLMFISLFQYMRGRQEGDEARTKRWLYIGAAAVALALSTMEVSFIAGFIGFSFIVVMSFMEGLSAARRRRLFLATLLLMVVAGLVIGWLLVGNTSTPPADGSLNLARQVVESLAGFSQGLSGGETALPHDKAVASVWKLFQFVVLIVGLLFAASTLALSASSRPVMTDVVRSMQVWALPKAAISGLVEAVRKTPLAGLAPSDEEVSVSRRTWGAVLLAVIIFVVLFTTFFTNPYGVVSGTWGGLSYWLRQQDVKRGDQPWYYYIMLLSMYEFLPVLVGGAGGVWVLARRWAATRQQVAASSAHRSAGGGRRSSPDARQAMAGDVPSAPSAQSVMNDYFVAFVVYWAIEAFLIYSWAGEKMPWLTVHMSLPLIFVAAWTVDRLLNGVDWRAAWSRGGAIFAVLLPLLVIGLITLLSTQPFQGVSIFDLRNTGQWLGAAIVVGLLAYALVHYGRRLGRFLTGRVTFAVVLIVLVALTIRFSWMASFINYDYVSEYIFYAHGAPDLTLAMNEIQDISRRTVGDKQIKIAYDNDSSWPLTWYFRDYPNAVYYADNPSREALDAPIVIVGAANLNKVMPFLGDRYERFDYRLVWWPIETYKDATLQKIWNTYFYPDVPPGGDVKAAWDTIDENRKELWDIIFYRRHKESLAQWPYVHRFYMFIRKDTLAKLWDYHIGPVTQVETDPYAKAYRELRAVQAIGNAGTGNGQFTTPRAIAVAPDGLLYVADSGNNRIEVLDANGNFVRAWGSAGNGPGQFQEPWGIAVSSAGRVYVADTWNHRIQVFDEQGNFIQAWGHFVDTQGKPDGEPGVFWGPRDLAFDAKGNLYVADTGNKRIQEFTPDGEFIAQFGGEGVVPGRFEEPTSLAFDRNGNIYVADAWNQRIQVFSPDFTPITQWPIQSWKSESVINKPFVRVDQRGNVYATDPEAYRVLVFNSQGKFITTFGQYGLDTASFALPLGMAFDSSGNLYVVDSNNSRVLRFTVNGVVQ
jgi:uncharacterized protein (TIGR03663 family)